MAAKELKLQARVLQPIIQIGKEGITEGVAEHLRLTLKKKKLMKIKLLRSFLDAEVGKGKSKKQIAEEVAAAAEGKVVEMMGLTLALSKN